ncbi:DUF3108 domain-containing protein [Flavobacterium caeni]|uniref:DUF3108 domain-containing protein n=1 Tax=Flavobacterium caeni TaxID=490189 RepID=A0A1G5FBW0_9FLAO|nr:hypothetical protein [Flavobacterium caeni]SCY36614.1 hypothetical protein SAMN02927903_01242 [Flavobacterium caeni]
MPVKLLFLFLSPLCLGNALAQQNDTVYISAANIKTHQLKEGRSTYLVYMKTGKEVPRSMTQFWSIDVKRKKERDKDVIEVWQSWEYKDTIVHTATSICDAQTFKPLSHESWWNKNGKKTTSVFDYQARCITVDGADATKDRSEKGTQTTNGFLAAVHHYHLNWHLDLEVFSTLPFALHTTYAIPFYEAGYKQPEYIFYTVAGEDNLEGYGGHDVACWLLTHETPGNIEKYWISKTTYEVLKLEQDIGGKMSRYKIKLALDN